MKLVKESGKEEQKNRKYFLNNKQIFWDEETNTYGTVMDCHQNVRHNVRDYEKKTLFFNEII